MTQILPHIVVGHEGWGKDYLADSEASINSVQFQAQPHTMSTLFNSAELAITARPFSPDYFTFAASFRNSGGILGSNALQSDSSAFLPSKSSIPSYQTHNGCPFPRRPSLNLQTSTFSSQSYSPSTPNSPGSLQESLTYSPLSPSTPASGSQAPMARPFLTNEELLFLSPQQSQILQEAHFEARRRASLPEQSSFWPAAMLEDRQEILLNVAEGNVHLYSPSLAAAFTAAPVTTVEQQASVEGNTRIAKDSYTDTTSSYYQIHGSEQDNQCYAAPRIIRPIPLRHGLAQILEESSSDRAVDEDIPTQALSPPSSGIIAVPERFSLDEPDALGLLHPLISAVSPVTPLSSDSRPSTSERAPSANTFRTSANAKIKQLGTFPSDEAFAGSLNELKSCGHEKPPYLWWTLIRAALLGSSKGKLQMDTLCAVIMEKFPYFGTAREAKNWKSSIRSVIHTKPCFVKTELKDRSVWWSVDVNIDPREQRRGLKKRSLSTSSAIGNARRPVFDAAVDQLREEIEEEEDDPEDSSSSGGRADGNRKKRRRTN